MKCEQAVFRTVTWQQPYMVARPLGGGEFYETSERKVVECGGDIITVNMADPDSPYVNSEETKGYCDECGAAYYWPYGVPD